ncbi:MAG TPA: S24 family peptidase [Rubrivivax sp.]|nr:S24 family peptidase [Rubrivivax sp.]
MNEDGCSGGEVFALRVLGHDMAPEFNDGEIIVIEPDGLVKDGAFVLAELDGGYTFRQLRRCAGGWVLRALNPPHGKPADRPLPDLGAVRGVIIQKSVPGRRRLSKSYL